MAVSENVMDLVALLNSEGFSVLAGEILSEISLGFEQEMEDGDEPALRRVPIAPDEQMREAVELLRLRLIEPARRLVEAEALAGALNGGGTVPIIFVDADGQPEVKAQPLSPRAQRRRNVIIDDLQKGLDKLVAGQSGAV